MKSNEILKALNLPNSKFNTQHCSKLAKVYELLKSISSDILTAEIIDFDCPLLFGRETKEVYRHMEWTIETNNHGTEVKAQKIKVTTNYGNYSFACPANNAFYFAVCDLLGICYERTGIEVVKPLQVIEIDSSVINAIKKAAKFVGKDDLRPAMQTICLSFENNLCEVIGTDAHQLYMSKKIACYSGKDAFKLLLSREAIKDIVKLKIKDKTAKIELLPIETYTYKDANGKDIKGSNQYANFAGLKVRLEPELRYPDYKQVIPDYIEYMEFNRVKLLDNVKTVKQSANKATNQVNFHLNGSISLHCQDVDFSFEADADMPYISKQFKDCDIAFNGNLLVNILGTTFKTDTVKMYSNGSPSRAAIFTDGTDNVLLIPLMMY
jgi:DNA polymerase III sliding clamp (beta) subunit (PCNA family)